MAKNKSAIKRTRKAQERKLSNMSKKSNMKTTIKKFEAAIADENRTEAEARLIAASSIVDKNASRGIVHKNKAARIKSRMTKKLNSLAL
ncbi:MAG: 30S ribosomal protein S20 [Syntrophomonadaceae bacterium]|nr:30S ribosomal protein S20 [Syntrophomonadaceae bacterium]